MADAAADRDPGVETFTYAGCEVTLVNGGELLAAAAVGRVELLHGATFPPPIRQVRFAVSAEARDGRPVHLLDGEIHTSADGASWNRAGPFVLGTDPIGLLLSRRLAAGDPWAERIVEGVGDAADKAYKWLGLGRPPAGQGADGDPAPAGPTVLEDVAVGLRATVTHEDPPQSTRSSGGRIVAVRAEVASDDVSPAHLRAMFCLVLRVVSELARDGGATTEPLAGRSYVLSRAVAEGPPPGPERGESVELDQVGGLPQVVAQFRQIAVSFRHPQVMARWGARRPQGILLYGPPGTGKTMLARALANEIGAGFREIRTPEILDKWLGASERNVKRIFREARRYREPTVMLFDEFDSIISYVGGGGDAASQAVNAVAGIFKQEMNNLIEENPNVIVVATTNFPERVDESLIRSGRFDIKIEVPRPDEAGRTEIIAKMVRDLKARHEVSGFRMFADDLDAAGLARGTAGMTGADIKELLRRVRLDKAMAEARTGVAGPITQADLMQAAADLRHAGAAS